MQQDTDKKIIESLEALSENISKCNSLKLNFLRGIFFGVGSVIGVSIIAAVIIATINQFIRSFDGIPVLENLQQIESQK